MHILITAGPTREYLDDVRYLSNASSGRMGYALAAAAIDRGHTVTLISGPVSISAPAGCHVIAVESTQQMYEACVERFADCDGVIGTAAVCDYTIKNRIAGKISKTGQSLTLELVETIDVLAELGRQKGTRWIVGFALESQDARYNAVRKLYQKNCDAIVLNSPQVISSEETSVDLIDQSESVIEHWSGSKTTVARLLMSWIDEHLPGRIR
ncbi:MAG: phosphopantothenoylcysteine decarboxylase [Planctomycetota bacterium]|nr:phosphopantothenoylcysteine decarboxylase [Planctomycetota bacterium]MDA1215094.1 phosphopantothenoylcysteine decarboxylase [Planctomycetota bacterium]